MSPHLQLSELDSLEILVIVDNELDPISPSPSARVEQSGGLRTIAMSSQPLPQHDHRGDARELRMDSICCAAHGLSLMITANRGDQKHTILFDTGPEEAVWERNSKRLHAEISRIEHIQLSHWHRDHSGGLLKVLQMAGEAKPPAGRHDPIHVDLHPARPDYRGFAAPNMPVISFEADPSFEDITNAGGRVEKSDQPHTVLNDMFLVSGEIPRVTAYEHGLKYGVRFDSGSGKWESDEGMSDERLLMCKLKGKGIVMFTGCSHAGVVNAAKHAVGLGGDAPLYAVMGGFHLADADADKIRSTVSDLQHLDAQILLTGHCTGWRAKQEVQTAMPGRLVPSFVGSRFFL